MVEAVGDAMSVAGKGVEKLEVRTGKYSEVGKDCSRRGLRRRRISTQTYIRLEFNYHAIQKACRLS